MLSIRVHASAKVTSIAEKKILNALYLASNINVLGKK